MGDPPFSPVAVNALRNKGTDPAGQIEMHNREVDRLRSELVHLDATLRLFDPYIIPDDIASRKRWPRRTDYSARGELTRLVFEAIRENGTTAARELAAAAMIARSINIPISLPRSSVALNSWPHLPELARFLMVVLQLQHDVSA